MWLALTNQGATVKFVYAIGSRSNVDPLKDEVIFSRKKVYFFRGSGCGSVGRAVASDTRGPRFESSHQQKFINILNICLLSTVY